jgi:hypothetical protein
VITTEDRATVQSAASGQVARLVSELERPLREPDCPACSNVSEIERSFFSWFEIESFSSPQVQGRLRAAFGKCKLDEELARMSHIADRITPNRLLLCNESFAATNEREGSEIARQVLAALLETGVKVIFVTHMFDLASGFHRRRLESALFLRAERGSDGARPFKIAEGEPLPTSYGEDSYRKVFGHRLAP